MTIGEFIIKHGISAKPTKISERIGGNQDDWDKTARHFHVYIRAAGREGGFACEFSQGSAHRKPPTASEVLSCLADDFRSVDNANSFDEWASDMGMDSDSRRAEGIWKTIRGQYNRVRAFLGRDAFAELISTDPE